jgi:hypothetical protein
MDIHCELCTKVFHVDKWPPVRTVGVCAECMEKTMKEYESLPNRER